MEEAVTMLASNINNIAVLLSSESKQVQCTFKTAFADMETALGETKKEVAETKSKVMDMEGELHEVKNRVSDLEFCLQDRGSNGEEKTSHGFAQHGDVRHSSLSDTVQSVEANPAAGSHATLAKAEPQTNATKRSLRRRNRWKRQQHSDTREASAATATCSSDAAASPGTQAVMSASATLAKVEPKTNATKWRLRRQKRWTQQQQLSDTGEPSAALAKCSSDAAASPGTQAVMSASCMQGTAVTWPSQSLLQQPIHLAQELQQPPPADGMKSSSSITSSDSSIDSANGYPDRVASSASSEQHRIKEERAAQPATYRTTGMSDVHRKALTKCRVEILDNLDVEGVVLDFLFSKNIVSKTLYEVIEDAHGRKAKAKLLLDDLPSGGKTAFHTFVEAMKRSPKRSNNELAELFPVVRKP